MGRLTDFLKDIDRGGAAVAFADDDAPPILGDEIIPFVEVGDPAEPGGRLSNVFGRPAAREPVALTVEDDEPPVPVVLSMPDALPPADEPGVFSIRFHAVHAGRPTPHGWGPELVAFHRPDHEVSGQYRDLVAEVVGQLPGAQPRLIAFAGHGPACGTTTVLLNLAVTLAQHGDSRAVVVDATDGGTPLATRLGLPAGPGLRDVLAQQTPLAWALHETRLPTLRALTAGKPGPRPTVDVAGLAEQLRGDTDWVIVDLGAWAGTDEQAAWAGAADAVYLVAREGDADGAAHAELQRAILDAPAALRGCVATGL